MKSLLLLAITACLAAARPPALVDSVLPGEASLIASIASAVSAAGLKPYVTPLATDEIKEWTALGDSYTAGIGADNSSDFIEGSGNCNRFKKAYPVQMNADTRWPGDPATRRLNFGACSGAKMQDLLDEQLSDKAHEPYVDFGKPQLAVVTISGNDLNFSKAINACILRILGAQDCDTVLNGTENKIQDPKFQGDLDNTLLAIVKKGRANGGANPPESFQLYVNGYVPFWNEVDTGCDTVTWKWPWSRGDYFLTTELRTRLNKIVREANLQIQLSAVRLASLGVIYVEGFQDSYTGHQFCDPKADPNLKVPISPNTWFWVWQSPWSDREEPATGSGNLRLPQEISNAPAPDIGKRARIENRGQDPSQFNDAFAGEENFEDAIRALADSSDPTAPPPLDRFFRMFHPKGTAYSHHSDVNIRTILAHRRARAHEIAADFQKGSGDPSLGSQQVLQACNDELGCHGQ